MQFKEDYFYIFAMQRQSTVVPPHSGLQYIVFPFLCLAEWIQRCVTNICPRKSSLSKGKRNIILWCLYVNGRV